MRKFNVRWWIVDPLEKYHQTVNSLEGVEGIRIRFIKSATPEDVLFWWGFIYEVKGPCLIQ